VTVPPSSLPVSEKISSAEAYGAGLRREGQKPPSQDEIPPVPPLPEAELRPQLALLPFHSQIGPKKRSRRTTQRDIRAKQVTKNSVTVSDENPPFCQVI